MDCVSTIIGLVAFAPYLWAVLRQWWILPVEFAMPGPMVLGLVVALILWDYKRRRGSDGVPMAGEGASAREAPRWLVWVVLVSGLASAGLWAAGRPLSAAPLLPIGSAAAMWRWYGKRVALRYGPLVAMLVFLAPLTFHARNVIQPPLTRLAAWIAWLVGTAAGIGPELEGNLVWTPHFYVRVIDSCSGLYMATMFLVVSLTLSFMAGWGRRQVLAVLGLSVPLALLLNGARLGVILWWGDFKYPEPVTSNVMEHDAPGLLLFAAGVAIISLVGKSVGRRATGGAGEPREASEQGSKPV